MLLVDDLVSDAIVAHASPSARIVYVGKRGGCKSTPQAFIEKLMLMAVNEGENVVRLKGGDPFIFGRGGEEVEHLRAAGRLRIDNKEASLEELGALSNPVLTKDAVAGRIRRLLAMADKQARDLKLPDTSSVLTEDMLDD